MNLDDLKKKAELAMPLKHQGKWFFGVESMSKSICGYRVTVIDSDTEKGFTAGISSEAIKFIAAANPDVVLKLITVVEMCKNIGPHYGKIPWPALEAALAELEKE